MAKEVCLCVEYALLNDFSGSFMIFLEASGRVKVVHDFSVTSRCEDTINSKLFLHDRTNSC